MPGLLIVNPRAGEGGASDLMAAAGRLGVATHVLRQGDDVAAVARSGPADGPLGVAGGDGSLGLVAGVAIEQDRPFVCVPFGTRNHFARDVGLDRDDPQAALAAFAGGAERRVDAGRVDGRVFLNNVSLGIYATLVHRREHHRRRRDAFARARALAILATHRGAAPLRVDGEELDGPLVLVSNNAYSIRLLTLGERGRLDEGLLHLYAPTGVLRPDWVERSGTSFTIDANTRRLRAAIDGEPAVLEPPVELTIEPQVLRVLLPREE